MDPMNSVWYYSELQRQSGAANRFSRFAKPESRPRKSLESWIIELIVPLFVFAAVVTFGVACVLCPTLVS
jgi:hypothetical protein